MSPALLGSEATVVNFTAVLHPPPGGLVEPPYVVALARFDEGVTILGEIVDVELNEVSVGDRVMTVSRSLGDRNGFAFRRVATVVD